LVFGVLVADPVPFAPVFDPLRRRRRRLFEELPVPVPSAGASPFEADPA